MIGEPDPEACSGLESAADCSGLEEAADGGVIFPRTLGLREPGTATGLKEPRTMDSWRSLRTPMPKYSWLGRDDEWRLPWVTKQTRTNKNLKKRKKLNEVSGRCLLCRSGLLSRCTQRGGTRSKLKITVFNIGKARQGNSRQGKAHRNTRSNK